MQNNSQNEFAKIDGPGTSAISRRLTLDQLRILVRRRESDSPSSQAVFGILEMLSQGVSPKSLEEQVAKQPGMALKIVTMAGSPSFGARHIRSIGHAIEVLGFDQLYSIVATLNLFSSCPKRQLADGIDRERFQKRCLLLGLFSRMLAKNLGLASPEEHYMAGLFQESGYLSMSRFCGEKLNQAVAVCLRTEVGDMNEIERYYMGFDHTDSGSVLGEESNFSPAICAAIRCHHAPMFAEPAHQNFADIGHISSWLADQLGLPLFEKAPSHSLDVYAVKRLGIEQSELESKVAGLRETAEDTIRSMGVM